MKPLRFGSTYAVSVSDRLVEMRVFFLEEGGDSSLIREQG